MYRLTLIFLRILGIALLFVGIVAAYYGPLEIFVFYFFSEGGQFHYGGFGMGSLWFAALVVQNIGYYVIAALFIPVGIGHIKLRRWALSLTQLYLWFWLGAGIMLFGNFFQLIPPVLELALTRDVLLSQLTAVGVVLLFCLVMLPILGLWFYRSERVKAAFQGRDPNRYWTESVPFPILALLLLFVILIFVLHIAAFLQGLFPMFGQILLGRPAAYSIAFCVLILGVLIYGTLQFKKWAWWGSLGFVLLLTISSLMSYSGYRFYDIILLLNLPAYEMELIDQMTVLHDIHPVNLVTIPLLVTFGLILYSKRYYVGINHELGTNDSNFTNKI